jgi:hypothetical protein
VIDLLLSFPSFEVATQVGVALGYVQVDDINNPQQIETMQADFNMAICIIGEHRIPSGDFDEEDNPIMVGDGKWWVLVRSLQDIELPEAINPFIVWSSLSGEDMPDDPLVPKRRWA